MTPGEENLLETLRQKKGAFQVTFNNPTGQQVLLDLAKVCGEGVTVYDVNDREHCRKTGRYEVWLYIAQLLNLSTEELFTLATGRPVIRQKPQEETEDASS